MAPRRRSSRPVSLQLIGRTSPSRRFRHRQPLPLVITGGHAGGPVVVVEPMTTSLYLEVDTDIGQHDVNFNYSRSQALDNKRSRSFIRDVIKEIR
ncbi:Scr1 family TA system antitoxin-like transcriptional regulator [Streptomyces sp. MS1.AVA.3]|uniref:Scr1 family TA system antitoxin-like transcriptional regulator n=2 Tax=Streptomyces nigrescens TaxID=1920 RepID=A0ABY7IPF2_STRNI|nr:MULTISPECIES: Scr1 family TA system antitoxin-like transcriptional regulator [Streptomyces]WAU00639.1 Scr1 family TA system antitoxin-like transcriptional regulator [Streptomyces libani subsp. libani]WDT53559.1 Scr1 family TA system antitoxin-like transcriptional regulator [Streptomyces sp. G7(2002)]